MATKKITFPDKTGNFSKLDDGRLTNADANEIKSAINTNAEVVDNLSVGAGGQVNSVVAGANVTVDSTDAANPIVSATAGDQDLNSVTTNGATTLNDISVGKIATLHPTNPLNHNTASGSSSASIGGTGNLASGNRSATIGGRTNQADGIESSTFGGTNQIVRGNESEGFGGTNITLNTKFTNTVGGANHVVGLATSLASESVAKHSLTVGGESSVIENATHSSIVGGQSNTIQTGHHGSVVLGGTGIITDAADTAYVPNLNVGAGFKMPTGATDTYVLTTDATGVGTWQASAGGGGQVDSVVAGTNVTIDNTDPINPIISAASSVADDTAYGVSWDGNTDAATKNVLYDKIETLGGGGSPVVASYVDNSFTITKPTSADVITPVTGLSYQMTSGTTYYIKVFVLSETAIGFDVEFIYLSHTPWANTAGIKEGIVGTHWNDEGLGADGGYQSGRTQFGGSWYEQSASRHYAANFSAYAGFSQIEGYITAPSTATFTPTISYLGTSTGNTDVRVQGMIMEMP